MAGSLSKSEGQGNQASDQSVWGAQSPYLQDLFAQGQNALGVAQEQNNQLMPQVTSAYENALNPQGNPYLDQMAQSGLGQLQQNFGQTLSQIRDGAVNTGSLGGARQGVAEGIAARDMGTQATNFTSALYGNNYQQDQNRALTAVNMAPQVANQAFSPLSGYQQVLGSPTVLGQSRGTTSSKSKAGAYG